MTAASFALARIPPVRFGAGSLADLPKAAGTFGKRALLVTGAGSLEASGHLERVRGLLAEAGMAVRETSIRGEPSTRSIDAACAELRGGGFQVVIGIGGGSVIDGAKALSAMLPHGNSVLDHLEDVGTGAPHSGVKVPFVAVPTTSGTGGEMTKNAVISQVGPEGYKKSLRHENLIPDAVIVDPELMLTCPRAVTAACGMDALTQLLEPFLSPACGPFLDSLIAGALERARDCLLPACGEGAGDVAMRAGMAYAALVSGIALANAGLGIVHGLASPLGGFFPIPHGVVCGTLVAAATRANLRALGAAAARAGAGGGGAAEAAGAERGLARYAAAGRLLGGRADRDDAWNRDFLGDILERWTAELDLPRLGEFGVRESDLDRVAAGAGNRNNPVKLTREEILALLAERL